MSAQRSAQAARKASASRAARSAPTVRPERPAGAVLLSGAAEIAAGWGPTIGRLLLGLVLAWFGYHELIQPAQWTGYVPGVHSASSFAIILVLAHGWVLAVLAVALIAGIAYRLAAALAAILLLQIVVSLTISAGLSDLTLRDIGVLGLAVCLLGSSQQRLALTS
ncbi:MAG: hypothetical protein ACLQFR_12530 [Streptosporangiaceae bacterium]